MALTVAAIAQLVLGVLVYQLGKWGRASADELAGPRLDVDEHRIRAEGVTRGGLACQAFGVLLVFFAIGTAIAAVAGVQPMHRPQ